MHEHSLRANCVEGAVGEAEGLCVANFEFHGQPSISATPDCFGDQRFAEVHASDKTVGACAAAHIQHLHAGLHAKTVQDRRFPRDCSGLFVGLVKKMKEKAGVGGVVDAREMGDVLAEHIHEV
jgi:hypothetical protein